MLARRLTIVVASCVVLLSLSVSGAAASSLPPLHVTWARTDQPVAGGQVGRTWMWGPQTAAYGTSEAYREAPDGAREVIYYDKARMEVTHPDGDAGSPWFVTNGLLVVELVSGAMQVGDAEFEERLPADVNVAGDPASGPSYAVLGTVLDAPPAADGAAIVQRLAADGSVTTDTGLAARGVTAAHHVSIPGKNHQIASPFWDFMNSRGLVIENGDLHEAVLFENPFYATGYPLTESYWTRVNVGGSPRDVLLQCFERRCLTYTPDNPEGWRVEAGNVGLHYYEWRYGEARPAPPTTSITFNIHFDGELLARTVTHETFLNDMAVGPWTTVDVNGTELSRGTLVAEHPVGQVIGNITQDWPYPGTGTMIFDYQLTFAGLRGSGRLDYAAMAPSGLEVGSVTFTAESESFDVDEWDIYLDAIPPVLFGGN
jgi:hypothetical protein